MLTTPGITASVTSAGRTISPDWERTRTSAPSPTPSRAASSGCTWTVQRDFPFTNTWRLCIHELFERRSRRPTRTSGPPSRAAGRSSTARSRPTSCTHASGAISMSPDGVRSTSGMRGCNGPRSTPCGSASSFASDRPSGSAPKPSPYGPVRSMKSSTRSGPLRDASAFISSSASRPSTFEPLRPIALSTRPATTPSSSASTSGCAPRPAITPASRTIVRHSGTSPGSSSTNGGE